MTGLAFCFPARCWRQLGPWAFAPNLKATCACRVDSDLPRLQDFFCAFDGQPASSNRRATLSDGRVRDSGYPRRGQMALVHAARTGRREGVVEGIA